MLQYTTFEHNIILPSLPAGNSCCMLPHMHAVHIKLRKHENMHARMQTLRRTHAVTHIHIPPTFFQRLANFDITVCSLELIEEGAHFEFICDSLPKLWHNSAVLPRGAHLKHSPVTPLEPLWCRPVHHLITLDVLRLLLHLVNETGGQTKTVSAWLHYVLHSSQWKKMQ